MTKRIEIPINLRWSDLDAFGHVNNVQVAKILEEARVRTFWIDSSNPASHATTQVIDAGPAASTWTVVARQEIEYLRSMPYYSQPIIVEAWFSKLGGASIEICYEVFGPKNSVETAEPKIVYYRAATTLVLLNSATQRPRKLSETERAAWQEYLGDPIQFRRS